MFLIWISGRGIGLGRAGCAGKEDGTQHGAPISKVEVSGVFRGAGCAG